MDESTLKQNIAANLVLLRRREEMTQLELAQKINYSDKTVSKWERGEGIPDVPTLISLAELFGVTPNELIYGLKDEIPAEGELSSRESDENAPKKVSKVGPNSFHLLVTLLSVGIVWLIAGTILLLMGIFIPDMDVVWVGCVLLYGLMVSFIVWLVLAVLWWPLLWQPICISGMIWSCAAALHLTLRLPGMAWIYAIAAVLQIMTVMWYALVLVYRRKRHSEASVESK